MIGLIPIYKRDSLEVKIEIYHQTMGMITKSIFKSLFMHSSLTSNSVGKGSNRRPTDDICRWTCTTMSSNYCRYKY